MSASSHLRKCSNVRTTREARYVTLKCTFGQEQPELIQPFDNTRRLSQNQKRYGNPIIYPAEASLGLIKCTQARESASKGKDVAQRKGAAKRKQKYERPGNARDPSTYLSTGGNEQKTAAYVGYDSACSIFSIKDEIRRGFDCLNIGMECRVGYHPSDLEYTRGSFYSTRVTPI